MAVRGVWGMRDEDVEKRIPEKDRNALDEFSIIGNRKVVANALEQLNRVDITKLDDPGVRAYADVLDGVACLRECLKEEERRPNAKVQPWGPVDDD